MSTIAIAPARSTVSRPARARRTTARAGNLLSNALLLLGIASLLLLGVGPHVLGYRTETMLTASMAPGIRPGDVVVVAPEPISELRVGDIVSYRAPIVGEPVVTHRVAALRRLPDGRTAMQTKGDANAHVDPWDTVLPGGTAWRVRAVIPHLGTAIRALRTPMAHHVLLWLVTPALVCWMLAAIWRPRRSQA